MNSKSSSSSMTASATESITAPKSVRKNQYCYGILTSVKKRIISRTWELLHDEQSTYGYVESNLRILLNDKSALDRVKKGSKLDDIIQSAIHRDFILKRYYVNHDFEQLINSFRSELHPTAVPLAIMDILDKDVMKNIEIIYLFDQGFLTTTHFEFIMSEYNPIPELFDESRWPTLASIIGNSWSYYGDNNRKMKAKMEKFALWSWINGYQKLSYYMGCMPDYDVHTFYCSYREQILERGDLLEKENYWFPFLSHASNKCLLLEVKHRDKIPTDIHVRCLIHHQMSDELLEQYDMGVIQSMISGENVHLSNIVFWIRLLARQLWELQKSSDKM